MARKKKSVTLPADLEAELDWVREAAPPPPPKEDPIYEYLDEVYRLRCKVEKLPELQHAIQKEHSAHHARVLRNYARVIIELTAPARVSAKMKHKYVTVLEYAFKEGVEPEDLSVFVKGHGGLNACVDLWNQKYGRSATKKPAKKKSRK